MMEHITKAATVTATTDRGDFTAIIAAYSVDRVGDRIAFGAFAKTIAAWRASGKRLPLHWNHRDDPQYIIGSFDPMTMEEVEGKGLIASGSLDLENSEMAREAWRAMKTGSMSLSFGYLVTREKKGKDGVNDLLEIDMFEGTIAPAPANADTRILSMKSAEEQRETAKRVERETEADRLPDVPDPPPADPELTIADLTQELEEVKGRLTQAEEALKEPPRSVQEQRREAIRLQREAEEEQIPEVPEQPKAPEPDLTKELQEVKAQLAEVLAGFEDLKTKQAEVTDKETKSRSVDPLRAQADAVALAEASGGESLRKPPRKVTPKPPELIPIRDLKQRMRDEMLARLSEGIPE